MHRQAVWSGDDVGDDGSGGVDVVAVITAASTTSQHITTAPYRPTTEGGSTDRV